MKMHLKEMINQKGLREKIKDVVEIDCEKKEHKIVIYLPIFRIIIGYGDLQKNKNFDIKRYQNFFRSVQTESISKELSSYLISYLIDLEKVFFHFIFFFFLYIFLFRKK